MAFDPTTIQAAYLSAITAARTSGVLRDAIDEEHAKALLSRLLQAMVRTDTASGNDMQAYSIAGRSVTYKTDGGAASMSNSVAGLQRKLDLFLGRSNMTSLSNMGATDG